MIEAVRQYASNRATSSEGELDELAQTLIYKLTPFVLPEKTLSTELMIWRVYSKQEKMEKKMEQFKDMQMELERRERKSSEEQMEQVHASLPIQDYAAATATTPRDGNIAKVLAPRYAAQPARPAKPTAQTTTTVTKPVNPNKVYNPCCMVVQAPELPINYERPRPEIVAIRVNKELTKHDETKVFMVVHIQFNVNNRCILNLQSDQRATDLELHANIFKHVVFPGWETVEVYPDENWFSVYICGIRTGIIDRPDGDRIRPAEEVRQELMVKNPDLHGRTIRVFRWVRPKGKLMEEGKYASLVVVSFEKEKDARYMTEERRNVSLYWMLCIVKEFTDKPPVIQCEECQNFHRKAVCKVTAKCRLCAEDHHENDHVERQEQQQQKKKRQHRHAHIGDVQTAKMVNRQTMQQMTAHAQDSRPSRPVGNTGTTNGGWQKVTYKQKGKKQMNPATEAGTKSEADPSTSGRRNYGGGRHHMGSESQRVQMLRNGRLSYQLVLDIQQGETKLWLVHLYNNPTTDRDNLRKTALDRVQRLALDLDMPMIITGDYNTHHPLWALEGQWESPWAEQLIEWMVERGLLMMNTKGVPTFFSQSNNGAESVIDLTFANAAAVAGNLLVDWRVDPDSAYTSDHSAIFWRLDQDIEVVNNTLGTQYNFKEADAGEWVEDFKIKVGGFRDSMREVEEATPESMDLELARDIKEAQNCFKHLCQRAKKKWLDDTLAEVTTDKIWSFSKWYKIEQNYPSPAIKQGEGETPAVTHEDKCNPIQDKLFQLPPELPDSEELELETGNPGDIAYHDVSREEVHAVLFAGSTKSTPEASQINYSYGRLTYT
ncbi:hypothetical protein ARMSODRAFT_973836 [Armillaria solidipes]|uniref:Endonuclease/exonuclease/phosphatase domain-containing protein n=1 Tax=Armillaria solidipes TaxID=1076256 RepID=A0A2H3C5L3_9AGAR|nr:hypothetical protein ARMSODRAFT_973836 [Armillaria solidipes]